jgi:hypothetical protein
VFVYARNDPQPGTLEGSVHQRLHLAVGPRRAEERDGEGSLPPGTASGRPGGPGVLDGDTHAVGKARHLLSLVQARALDRIARRHESIK